MAAAQIGHFGHQLLRLVERAHDLREHVHDLPPLGLHIGPGKELAGIRIELEQLLVEECRETHGHRLELLRAPADQALVLGCHASFLRLASPYLGPSIRP
jgi:hypothetical protein